MKFENVGIVVCLIFYKNDNKIKSSLFTKDYISNDIVNTSLVLNLEEKILVAPKLWKLLYED